MFWGDATAWFLTIGMMALALYAGIHSSWKPPRPKPYAVVVTSDGKGFTVFEVMTYISIRWTDIRRVTLISTDRGPWRDSFFYHVSHVRGDVTLPAQAVGVPAFVESLQRYHHFEMTAFEKATRSRSTETFVVVVRNEEPVA